MGSLENSLIAFSKNNPFTVDRWHFSCLTLGTVCGACAFLLYLDRLYFPQILLSLCYEMTRNERRWGEGGQGLGRKSEHTIIFIFISEPQKMTVDGWAFILIILTLLKTDLEHFPCNCLRYEHTGWGKSGFFVWKIIQ